MSKKHKHMHTGKLDVHHVAEPSGRDPHASKTYHKNNAAHGMCEGSGDNCNHCKNPMYGAGSMDMESKGSTRGSSGDTTSSGFRGSGKTMNGGEGMGGNAKPKF